jgi:DNA-directed RNA polymerase beta' subunit
VVLTNDHLSLEGVLRYQGDNRFEKIVERLEKVDSCFHCKSPKPKISFVPKTFDITMKYEKTKIILTDAEIKKIFDNVPDEDVSLLGFNPIYMHPKNLVLSVLQVMPPRARPYIISDSVTCDDDLTISLLEITKANKCLADPEIKGIKKDKCIQTLKFRIKTMMNNSQSKARHSNGRPLKGIKERLSGKTGLIRQNLMGKRRNFSGRSPISADPTVRTDELVVPEQIAKNLTVPEIVVGFNKDYLQKLVDEGKANFVLRGGTRINLKYATSRKGTQILWGDKIIRGGKIFDTVTWSSNGTKMKKDFELQVGDQIIRSTIEPNGVKSEEILMSIEPEIGDEVTRTFIRSDGLKVEKKYIISESGDEDVQVGCMVLGKNTELQIGDEIKRTIVDPDGVKTEQILRNSIELTKPRQFKVEIGDEVERHLKNGDVVLFNQKRV